MAAAGAAVIGAGASYAGSKKQSDAAKKGSNIQLQMFDTLNAQQQPFIQSGYGAMGRLNTLLGLGARAPVGGMPAAGGAPTMGNHMYRPTPAGGVQEMAAASAAPAMGQNMRLKQLLALRAAHGDTEAERILGAI